MVVSDSCYSGTLTRGLSIKKRTPDYVREAVSKRARVVITSGGLEPVADKSGGANSPFATVFLKVLNSNDGVLDGTQMFKKMRRPVVRRQDFWNGRLLDSAESLAHLLFNIRRLDWRIANVVD
jgi:molybdopterin-biosynthesis enzyme MoeA-like protein